MENPGKVHWKSLKWVLRYVMGTTNHGSTYGNGTYGPNHIIMVTLMFILGNVWILKNQF